MSAIRMKGGRVWPKSEAAPTLEHKVERLYLIAHNFDARFVALEMALARLQTTPITAAPKRVRKS
jgi:hypothetical protein